MARAGASLTELLFEHGIPERAARLYVGACREGPQTVAELARASGLHRVEAYRCLQVLLARGLLRSTGGRPARYVALPLDQLLDRWIRRSTEKLDRWKGDREKLLAEWRENLATADPGEGRKFAVLEGRPAIQRFLRRRIDAAEKEILLSVSGFSLAPAIEGGVDRSLRAARARGVRVRLVTEVSGSNLPEARHFAGIGDLRHAQSAVTNRAIVIDRGGALVFVSGEEGLGKSGDDQVALWTSSPSVLLLARNYHQRLWTQALSIDRRLLELEHPPTAVLPVVRGKEAEPFSRLREITQLGMRASGLTNLDLDLPEMIRALGRQMGTEVAQSVTGSDAEAVMRSLAEHYERHAPGRLEVLRNSPLTVRVTQCFACTPQGTEIGRVLCPKLFQTILEQRMGSSWAVSTPDPRRHATKGCLFVATPA
ncbi:MAG TPA: helix-turn-helix domain-containing protein [Thermoplasmata archaeon]|nr:helix-turn-helix domain-containing protein [Thermoplasmata archaeon]